MKICFRIFRFLFIFLGFNFCPAELFFFKLARADWADAHPSQAGPPPRRRLPRGDRAAAAAAPAR